MVRDGSGELRKLTERFAGEKDSVARRSLLERIMLKWSEVSNVETTPNGGWLGFLEKFYGARYDWSSLTERGRRQLESAYESVSLYLYGNLLRQSHYADELEMLDYHLDGKGGFFLNTGRALESIVKENVSNPEQTKRSIAEFFLFLKISGLYKYVDEAEVESHAALLSTYGSELPDVCRASYLAMKEPVGTYTLPYFVPGQGGVLEGDIHNNVLVGSEGSDILKGGYGSDVLMGGHGSDTLVGGHDGDTYVWNLGDGDDRIVNSSSGLGEEDVLRLGKGIHPENVEVERYGNTIRLRIGESGEVLTLSTDTSLNGNLDALDPELQIARVEFADGTVWSREYLLGVPVEIAGTDGDDVLEGSVGDDVLSGGRGADVMQGGRGSDTYVWRVGDGNDRIEDERTEDGTKDGKNVLRLEGVAPGGVNLVRDRDSLVLEMRESGERIELLRWYNQLERDRYRLHEIRFEDGTVWTPEDVEGFEVGSRTIKGTDGDDVLDGTGSDDFLEGLGGADVLRGGRGSDTYLWKPGDGDDTIIDPVSGDEANALRFGEGVKIGRAHV